MLYLRMRQIFFPVVFFFISVHSTFSQDLAEIIRVAEIGDNQIRSGIGKMVYENEQQEPLNSMLSQSNTTGISRFYFNRTGEWEFAFEDNRYLFTERMLEDVFMEDVYVFDGTMLTTINILVNSLGEQDSSFSYGGSLENPYSDDKHRTSIADPRYHSTILGEPVAAFLSRDAEFIEEITYNGMPCFVFKGTRYSTDQAMKVYLTHADLYHRPVYIEKASDRYKSTYEIEYSTNNGLIIPLTVHDHYYVAGENDTWTLTRSSVYTMLDESRFNVDVPDDMFELVF